jgi:hypothetical protein
MRLIEVRPEAFALMKSSTGVAAVEPLEETHTVVGVALPLIVGVPVYWIW